MAGQKTCMFFLVVAALAVANGQSTCGTQEPISEADMRALCSASPIVGSSIACHIFSLCYSPDTTPPLSSVICEPWRLTSSLCSDDDSISSRVPKCAALKQQYPSAAIYSQCVTPFPGIQKTSAITFAEVSMCKEMTMDGCSLCDLAAGTCTKPTEAYTRTCTEMQMTGCEAWEEFCNSALAGGSSGTGAAVLCKSEFDRRKITMPPRPPPMAASSSPSSPTPTPTPSVTRGSTPAPVMTVLPSAAPRPANLSDADATADVQRLCSAMNNMPGCTLLAACKSGRVSGKYCAPFTLLATICVDMPMMRDCNNYTSFCGALPKPVRCSQLPAVPSWPSTMGIGMAVNMLCRSNTCTNCTTVRCPEPLTTLTAVCKPKPAKTGCTLYSKMCKDAPAWGGSSSALTAFCTAPRRSPPPSPRRRPSTVVRRSPPPMPRRRPSPPLPKRRPPPIKRKSNK